MDVQTTCAIFVEIAAFIIKWTLWKKGLKIKSQEGTTQGDTTAMAFYALSLMKLIKDAKTKAPAAKEVFYADDGAAGGKLDALSHFWRHLQEDGPKYGYFVNPSKSYLIV